MRPARVQEDRSILDGLAHEISKLSGKLGGHDRAKLGEYLGAIRDVEQRIAKAESTNSDFEIPDRPVGVPETFKEYAELMFDLQGAYVPGGCHTRHVVHDGARKHQSFVHRDWIARGAPLDVAPR